MFDWFMKRTKGDHKLEKTYTLDEDNLNYDSYWDRILSSDLLRNPADLNNRITNVYAGNPWTNIGHLSGKHSLALQQTPLSVTVLAEISSKNLTNCVKLCYY